VNIILHFLCFDLNYPTQGLTVTWLAMVYCIVCEFAFIIVHLLQVMKCCWPQFQSALRTSHFTEVCFPIDGTPSSRDTVYSWLSMLIKGERCMNNPKTGIIQVFGVIKRLWWLLDVEIQKCVCVRARTHTYTRTCTQEHWVDQTLIILSSP
jgi:hypothetical protein